MQIPKKHCGIFTRVRHLRGHGIHSPFVYSLVRSVFNGGMGSGGELYDALRSEGVGRRISYRIQKLYTFCEYGDFSLGYRSGAEMCIIMPHGKFSPDMVAEAPETTFIVVAPYSDSRKINNCLEVAAANERLTLDLRSFFCIFHDRQHPVQHFRI